MTEPTPPTRGKPHRNGPYANQWYYAEKRNAPHPGDTPTQKRYHRPSGHLPVRRAEPHRNNCPVKRAITHPGVRPRQAHHATVNPTSACPPPKRHTKVPYATSPGRKTPYAPYSKPGPMRRKFYNNPSTAGTSTRQRPSSTWGRARVLGTTGTPQPIWDQTLLYLSPHSRQQTLMQCPLQRRAILHSTSKALFFFPVLLFCFSYNSNFW